MAQFSCPEGIDTGYYSIVDPHDGSVTHWFRPKNSAVLKSWPAKANPGPRLLRKDVPKGEARIPFLREWNDTVAIPYADAVRESILVDSMAALARFASFSTRCFYCGKTLTDATSKCYGMGPECRRGFSAYHLELFAAAMSRALSERESEVA